MNKTRVIPVLLLAEGGLVKTIQFKNPTYIGDPINAVKIFNDKEVDELMFLDINATKNKEEPNYGLLSDIVSEAFMPMSYGGGISNLDQIRKVIQIGFEKVVINSAAYLNLELISEAATMFGSQSVAACVDVKKKFFGGYQLLSSGASIKQKIDLIEHISALIDAGVGEIIIQSVDQDGSMSGYDLDLMQLISRYVKVPLVACGGAGSIDDFVKVVETAQVTGVAAGSMFVFVGPQRGVLITYPERQYLSSKLP